MATMMDKLGVQEGEVIEHKFMTKAIERAQKRVEEQNFGIRKHLLEYDNVMNKQREIIYGRRLQSLEGTDLEKECRELVGDIAAATVEEFTIEAGEFAENWDLGALRHELGRRLGVDLDFEHHGNEGPDLAGLKQFAVDAVLARYGEREKRIGTELIRQFERFVTLTTIDSHWKDHLYALDRLREGIGLRAYGQKDPLLEYKKEAFQAFSDLMDRIDLQSAERLMKTEIRVEAPAAVPARTVEHRALAGIGAPAGAGRAMPPMPGAARPALPPGGPGPVRGSAKQVGRNDPCPCGSGKKYKKCHGRSA
jgi:preprotein translocase subunit SecA